MTTRRPTLPHSNKSRPLSAIFLGSISTPSHIPALPEPPPSPGGGSTGSESGLPSPPATNSTGSGSNGDDTTNFGSVRQRPASYSHPFPDTGELLPALAMPSAIYHSEIGPRSTTNLNEEQHTDDYDEHDNDLDDGEDNTARLDKRRSLKGLSENTLALQRVKSLAQRNRMALDKLSSISRLSSPSPSPSPVGNRAPRSPMPPQSTTSSSSSQSRQSGHLHSQSDSFLHPRPPETPHHHSTVSRDYHRAEREQLLSGSETERDQDHRLSLAESNSSSDTTPPSSASTSALRMTGMVPPIPSSPRRPRRTSLPTSPMKALNMTPTKARAGRREDRSVSPGPSRTPMKRPSTATPMFDSDARDSRDRHHSLDLTSAALAAVARSRSPATLSATSGNSKSKRTALPREFMGRDRRSLDGKSTGSVDLSPQTPHRQPTHENTNVYLGRGSPDPNASVASFASTPGGNPTRSPRAKTGRSSTVRDLTRRHQTRWLSEDLSGEIGDEDVDGGGRRQTPRGGSMESPLSNGRSLVGEGLKAAGLKTRRGEDVFGGDERNLAGGSGRGGEPNTASTKVSFDTRSSEDRRAHRASYNGVGSRPSTSMTESNHGKRRLCVAKGASTDLLATERDSPGLGSSIYARQSTASTIKAFGTQDRAGTASPFGITRRHTPVTPLPPRAGSTAPSSHHFSSSEHGCLMLESLQMFESNLAKLPPMGTTSTQTIPELFRSAQNIVNASDKLNALLRAGTNGALEEQIDAEVGGNDEATGGEEIAEVWRRVGGEMRESLRISDEIVRTMTGFLLGLGRVLKDTAAVASISVDDVNHSRSASIDEEFGVRRTGASPDIASHSSGGRLSRDGRSSVSRDSWEQPPRTLADTSVSRRLSSRVDHRPPSALNGHRDIGAQLDSPSESERAPASGRSGLAGTVRRLFTPREQRDHQVDPTIGHEPSPSPVTRNQGTLGRARTLPPISVPPPLPNLPSESPLHRNATDAKNNRRKPSMATMSTLRGSANPIFPSVATATTAVSTGDGGPFPLTRNDSGASTRSTNVTFSRPSTISVSALNGIRKRTISTTSSNAEEVSTSVQQVVSPLEAERDNRRKTVGARAGGRMSLDSAVNSGRVESSTGTHRTVVPSNSAARRDRRRTVTEIFS
ncbi:hypothetical protein HWV62_125 [Athelia sp. TMB]|nr:hypothetical protein HWV62_125 [Athelia sp. TMB]